MLSSDEVDRMVKDADANSEVDKKRRTAIDTRNNVRTPPVHPGRPPAPCLPDPACQPAALCPCAAAAVTLAPCRPADGARPAQADSMVYQTEKQLKEFGEKVPADVKSKIESGLQTLKDAISKEDTDAMTKAIDALRQDTMAMGQAMYSQVRGWPHVSGCLPCSGARTAGSVGTLPAARTERAALTTPQDLHQITELVACSPMAKACLCCRVRTHSSQGSQAQAAHRPRARGLPPGQVRAAPTMSWMQSSPTLTSSVRVAPGTSLGSREWLQGPAVSWAV